MLTWRLFNLAKLTQVFIEGCEESQRKRGRALCTCISRERKKERERERGSVGTSPSSSLFKNLGLAFGVHSRAQVSSRHLKQARTKKERWIVHTWSSGLASSLARTQFGELTQRKRTWRGAAKLHGLSFAFAYWEFGILLAGNWCLEAVQCFADPTRISLLRTSAEATLVHTASFRACIPLVKRTRFPYEESATLNKLQKSRH